MLERNYVHKLCVCVLYITQVAWTVQRDVVFVIDTSGSILQSDFDVAVDFLSDVINALTIGTGDVQVSVVTFADTDREEFALNAHTGKTDLLAAINALKSITTSGGTFTADALNYVHTTSFTAAKGQRPTAIPIVVVIADGRSQNTLQAMTAADNIRSTITGSIIYVIGVGGDLTATTLELQLIASDPDTENVMYVTAYTYICNLVPILAVKIDNTLTVSLPAGCLQITTPTGKGVTTTGGTAGETAGGTDDNKEVIAGSVVAAAGGLAAFWLIIFAAWRMKKKKKRKKNDSEEFLAMNIPPPPLVRHIDVDC